MAPKPNGTSSVHVHADHVKSQVEMPDQLSTCCYDPERVSHSYTVRQRLTDG